MAAEDQDQKHKERLRAALEEGGADKFVALSQGTADPALRRKLYILARQVLPDRRTNQRRFDDVIRVARAGVAEALRQAELARARSDAEEARECIDLANRLSYNLAADLAECWPGDEARRERHHLEAGLRAAYDCVVWRQELGKPPDRRAMAPLAPGGAQRSPGKLVRAPSPVRAPVRPAPRGAAGRGRGGGKPRG